VLRLEAWMDVKSLKRDGNSIKAIVRLTGHSRNTLGAPAAVRPLQNRAGAGGVMRPVTRREAQMKASRHSRCVF